MKRHAGRGEGNSLVQVAAAVVGPAGASQHIPTADRIERANAEAEEMRRQQELREQVPLAIELAGAKAEIERLRADLALRTGQLQASRDHVEQARAERDEAHGHYERMSAWAAEVRGERDEARLALAAARDEFDVERDDFRKSLVLTANSRNWNHREVTKLRARVAELEQAAPAAALDVHAALNTYEVLTDEPAGTQELSPAMLLVLGVNRRRLVARWQGEGIWVGGCLIAEREDAERLAAFITREAE